MDGSSHQMFVAPGDEEAPLTEEASPWIFGHVVRLPLDHWERIVEFAQTIDAQRAQELDQLSYHREGEGPPVPREQVESAIAFLSELEGKVMDAAPLTPEGDLRFVDAFENFEHARMMKAVRTVLSESLNSGESFESYAE
jgi:hypothetical protein